MARPRTNSLPRHLEFNRLNSSYYYRNPSMPKKQNLGKDRQAAIEFAKDFNRKYRLQLERESSRYEAVDLGADTFAETFTPFVEKYIVDHRIKRSTAQLLRQRRERLLLKLGNVQVPAIDTELLREAIMDCSPYEQSKIRTLASRFFRYAKSTGKYPNHLPNPVDDLYLDPVPPKRRQRMTIEQFHTIYAVAPEWLQWTMTLAFHLALRRVDLLALRFTDIIDDRIVSAIRKTETEARGLESTSVDFPIHDDVRRVIATARESSLRNGRCPFIIHRTPERQTKKASQALEKGTLLHPSQILPDYASKAFARARTEAAKFSSAFDGLEKGQMPTLHEIRALSSHLYERAGYEISAVQDLMAHTDPDMTRHYQKGHARKVLRVNMILPFSVSDMIKEPAATYCVRKVA